MNKQEYLDKLELELRRLNVTKLTEVLADYQEHFQMGTSKGKTEQEIIEKLGEPSTVAKAYQAENLIQRMESSSSQDKAGLFFKAFLRALILTPFNFIMLLGPFLILGCILFAGWTLALTFCGSGLGIGIGLFALMPLSVVSIWAAGAVFFGSICLISVSLLGLMLMFYLTKFSFSFCVQYLKWNIDFVKGSAQ